MTYLVRIDNKKDFLWLRQLLDRALDRTQTEPGRFNLEVSEHIESLHKALENAVHMEQTSGDRGKGPLPKQAKPRRKKNDDIADISLCPTHKNYTAKYRPRNLDCEICWNAFEKFHGKEETRRARRKLERKLTAEEP